MIKGQIVAGDFSSIIMRVKAGERVELGELVIVEKNSEKFILQVYDLQFGSQISQQNMEMVAGLNLEEGNFEIMDSQLRNYTLALLKPVLTISKESRVSKSLPPLLHAVRGVTQEDLQFITTPRNPLFTGMLRSGSASLGFSLFLPGTEVLSHHVLIPASTGKGKSNLMSCLLWDIVGKGYAGMLVLDPHDEYYGRTGLGLKDLPLREQVSYYTPYHPPVGGRTLVVNLKCLKPEHFQGAVALSEPQRQCLFVYFKKYREDWITAIVEEKRIEGVQFHEDTIAVVKRKLISLLGLELNQGKLSCQGVFDDVAGQNTISDICRELEQGKVVIVDTSYFAGAIEILVGSMIAGEIFDRYKYHKRNGLLDQKPVISIALEEAPRVLGKNVLEQGSNIFESIAREGRKFKVGLLAITQLPSEIPKSILANMNTKIILGIELKPERQAIIESAAQDLSSDDRMIASLDKGEIIVTSNFLSFAMPLKVPLIEYKRVEKAKQEFTGIRLG